MSDGEPQTDAAKRVAARRAKILARGSTGLQKLAQTARGEEAEKLYGGDSASSSRPATPSVTSPPTQRTPASGTPSWLPPNPGNNSVEQQQMQDQLRNMMAMLGGGGSGGDTGAPGGGMPDMSNFLAEMMGQAPPGTSAGLLGDLDDPAGLGGTSSSNPFNPTGNPDIPNFPDLSQLANFGMNLPPGMGGSGPEISAGKGWVERVYPMIHVLAVLSLLAFVLGWWEPSIRMARWAGSGEGVVSRWARLAGRRGGWKGAKSALLGDVESLPLFWAFTTLELILQTTRFIILKSPPQPHSLISTFLPMLPPHIARPILTGSRYLTMLSQIYKDGCLLIFGLGLFVIVSEYVSV